MKILGSSYASPATRESAAEIARAIGKSPSWVERRIGIRSRPRAVRETAADLAAQASRRALDQAGIRTADLGWILSGNGTPDQAIPGNAALLQAELGAPAAGIPCLDVGMTCLGFLAGLHVAEQFFRGGLDRPILLACADIATVGISPERVEEYCLFGDGAAAFVLGPSGPASRSAFRTFGQFSTLCELPAGGSRRHPSRGATASDFLFRMDGPRLYRAVLERYPQFLAEFLSEQGQNPAAIDWLVPHQASRHAIDAISDRVGFPASRRIDIFADHGNQVSASLPTALHLGLRDGRIRPGHRVLLGGTSAGVSFGATLLEIA
jgi:3-oxoacyl-[acyl-carrier-protein] synthase-3